MTEIWVYKPDGTIQCVPSSETEVSLTEMRKQLEALIGAENVVSEEKRSPLGPVPAVCGRPTGNLNAYKITPLGLQMLFSGVVGPSGFEVDPQTKIMFDPNDPVTPWPFKGTTEGPIVPWPTKTSSLEDDRWVPWPFVAVSANDAESSARALANVVASLSVAGAIPTTITELIGRVARVYNEGDMITLDYLPQRVNIVFDRGRISRIWFG
ncbi:UNVERIFIED_ORG: hypothetical protein J2W66_003148 [Agrobacterium larrymoorei]|nr:hypothetical protein [Agrobacterium larrymoorei]